LGGKTFPTKTKKTGSATSLCHIPYPMIGHTGTGLP